MQLRPRRELDQSWHLILVAAICWALCIHVRRIAAVSLLVLRA